MKACDEHSGFLEEMTAVEERHGLDMIMNYVVIQIAALPASAQFNFLSDVARRLQRVAAEYEKYEKGLSELDSHEGRVQ